MENYFKIGDVAEAKGFTIDTLRYYDKIGLVKPAYVDPETNYRYYTSQQLYKLEIIKYLKSMDVSNEDLLHLCRNKDINEWDRFLSELSRELRKKIDMLIQSIARIDSMRQRNQYLKSVNEHDGIYYKHFDARYVIERECHSLPTKDETIGGFTALYKEVSRYSLDNTFQSGAVLSFNKDLMQFSYEKIYVEVSNCPAFASVPHHRILPAGLYICINNDLEDAEAKSKLLMDYVCNSGITPRVITEEYVFTNPIGYEDPHMALQILAD